MSKKIKKITYLFYGLGVGYFLLDQIFNQWIKYYYLPAEKDILQNGLVPIMSPKYLALAFVIMRLVDAIADPLVGYLSDNSKSKFGRRSIFMIIGIIPLGLSMIAFFYPLKGSELFTTLYVSFIGSIYFIAYTLVGGPYNAMLADIANNKEERLSLSTVQSVFRLIFTAIPMVLSPILVSKFRNIFNISLENSIRYVIILFSIISVILVLISIFGVNERKNSNKVKSEKKVEFKQYFNYLKTKEIILYFIGFFFFFSGFNIIRNSVLYYVVAILSKEAKDAFIPTAILFLVSAIFFPITQYLCKKYSYRKIMLLDLILIIIGVLGLIFLGRNNTLLFYLMFIIVGAGVSGSAFIFPPAMLSEIATSIYEKHGVSVEGMMFGIQGLFLKLALLVELVLTTLILTRGSKIGGVTPEGVITILFVSIVFLIISFISYFMKKNEI